LTAAPPRSRKTSQIVLDSSCWLEYFAETAYAARFDAVIANPQALIVPVITIYEVVKKPLANAGKSLPASRSP